MSFYTFRIGAAHGIENFAANCKSQSATHFQKSEQEGKFLLETKHGKQTEGRFHYRPDFIIIMPCSAFIRQQSFR